MCKKFSKYIPTFGKNHKIYYLCTALGTYIGMLEQRIVLWCNGSTAVFGSACLGSNPGKTTQQIRKQLIFNACGFFYVYF